MIATQDELNRRSIASRQRAAEHRKARVIALHVAGVDKHEIANQLAVSIRTVHRDLVDTDDIRVDVEAIIQDVGVDAEDIHLKLSRMLDADLKDLYDAEGNVLPVKDWPEIWRQGLAVEITEEDMSTRSSDGVQAGQSKSWDKAGVRRKLKVYDRSKLIELAGRLKPVDAFVKQGADAKEIAGEVMSEIDKRIAAGRQRAARMLPENVQTISSGDIVDINQ